MTNTTREAAKETLGVVAGTSRTHIGNRESWWLSDEVQIKVKVKQTQLRELILMHGGDQANRFATDKRYKEAKREAKKVVAIGNGKAYEDLYKRLDSKEGENDIYSKATVREREIGSKKRANLQNNCYCSRIGQTEVKEALRMMGRNKVLGSDEILIEA
ncbi:hypothetical protein Tco_0614033 [Tanacetum coccineum]